MLFKRYLKQSRTWQHCDSPKDDYRPSNHPDDSYAEEPAYDPSPDQYQDAPEDAAIRLLECDMGDYAVAMAPALGLPGELKINLHSSQQAFKERFTRAKISNARERYDKHLKDLLESQ